MAGNFGGTAIRATGWASGLIRLFCVFIPINISQVFYAGKHMLADTATNQTTPQFELVGHDLETGLALWTSGGERHVAILMIREKCRKTADRSRERRRSGVRPLGSCRGSSLEP